MRIALCAALGMLAVTLSPGATGHRKITENGLSPTAETSVTLGGHAITIEYNAPSARGRQVEGGLVPYGSVWRLGADSATTLTADADITIGALKVPKGVYTLYIMASANGWNLIVNKQTGQWGTDYDQSQDLGRVPMKVSKLGQPAETLKIALGGSGTAGMLEIMWGGTKAAVAVKLG
jgi:hypothetical protein